MRAKDLAAILNAVPEAEVVFEIWEEGKEPDTSYGVDNVIIGEACNFVVLRSVD